MVLTKENCPSAIFTRESRIEKSSDSDINAFQQSALLSGLYYHRLQVGVTFLDTVQNIFKPLFMQQRVPLPFLHILPITDPSF
jgi:hypothetical protein